MSEADSPSPTLASRLGQTCVELRPDLEVSRHVFRGRACYILQDPLTFQSHRFSVEDYRVITSLDSERTLAETFLSLVRLKLVREADEERFFMFVYSLHKTGLLKLPISDEKSLYKRHQAKASDRRKQALKSFLFWRVPLVNPDRFLNRTIAMVRPFFSRTALIVWSLLVATAFWVVLRNWSAFTAPAADIFSGPNLPLLWITLVVLKVAHELGHAYACKHFGGHVPEMGAFFIVGTPCAYVDATASWGFSRKRERLFVSLAGMYVELAIAAVAVIAWAVTPAGLLQQIFHNVVMLASVVTVGFNINPLMRYDGYYALSDVLETPNLRSRANEYGIALLKRFLLGVKMTKNWGSKRYKYFLASFAFCAAIYKFLLVAGISLLIATKVLLLGVIIGVGYIFSEGARVLIGSLRYLLASPELSDRRARAVALSLAIFVALPMTVLGIPLPARVYTPGVLLGEDERHLRVEASGFLEEVDAVPGQRIEAGDLIARLVDPHALLEFEETKARLEAARLQHTIFEWTDPAQAQQESERVAQLEHELEQKRLGTERLELRAETAGTVVRSLSDDVVGTYLTLGREVAVVSDGTAIVRGLLREADLASTNPTIGQSVAFRSPAFPARSLEGTIRRIRPAGTRVHDPLLAEHLDLSQFVLNPMTGETREPLFEVEVALTEHFEKQIPRGLTGQIQLPTQPETLARMLYRKGLLFFHRLRGEA